MVIGAGDLQTAHGLLWLAIVTSSEHRGWPGNVIISDLGGAGAASSVNCSARKIATTDAGDAGRLGTPPPTDREAVRIYLRQRLSDLG